MFLDPEEYDKTMMGKTHLFMGITAAAVLTRPDTVGGCLAALMGGAVGGVLSDIDVKSGKGRRDDPDARIMAGGICVLALGVDHLMGGGILAELNACGRERLYLGLGLLALYILIQISAEIKHICIRKFVDNFILVQRTPIIIFYNYVTMPMTVP